MRVRGYVGDAVAVNNTPTPENRRESVAALEKLAIGEPPLSVDDGLAMAIEAACATGKLHGR
jgi:hypothetical protein